MYRGEERIITIPGFAIAAREWGKADGMPVLATHGWLDNASSFEFLAPLLQDTHVVAIDSPGCGYSTHRPQGVFPSIFDDIVVSLEVASALGWNRFVLMGHSKGAAMAQVTAAASPERVAGLILLDMIGMLTNEGESAVERLRNSVKSVFSEQRPATQFKDLKEAAEGRRLAAPISYESALALATRGTDEVDGKVVWNFDRRERNYVTFMRPSKEQAIEFLEGVEAPTCIVLAEEGIIKDSEFAKSIAQRIRNHEMHFVPGGHHVHMDDAKRVADILNPFLKSLRKS